MGLFEMLSKRKQKSNTVYTGVKEIADRLKLARENAGYATRKEFALKNNIPPATYQKHESGARNILAPSIINYCKILNISIVWLMTGCESHKDKGFDAVETSEEVRKVENDEKEEVI